ncbi:MAG: Fic family protein [Caldilineales bacterium]|nr:Fic family protein [Caldilineales bacterium]MCW5859091.1 Fic family protein [Caldilineales bacterium]
MSGELSVLLAQIDAKRALLAERRPLSAGEAARLREYLDVEWTYHSNSIEGSTLTRQETLVVLKHGLTIGGKTLVEHLEATNHKHAIDHVIQLATQATPPSEADILALHRLILHGIDDENAGAYRQRQVFIAGSDYVPPPPPAVPGRMAEFGQWLERRPALHPVERAAHAHFWLVDIHPFVDGNGRVARLLMNLLLLQSGYPIAIVRTEDRLAYYAALEAGHAGRLNDFLLLVAAAVDRTADLHLSATADL